MRPEDARAMLRQGRVGVLALARGGDAYGLPVYYAFDGRHLYFHTHPGHKSDYIGATREACFTLVAARSTDEWASIMVFGVLERVDGTPSHLAAMHALMAVPLPPEWGVSEAGEPRRGGEGAATYRLTPTRISGRFSQREVEPSALEVS
jgi:nitroimidazol reductase NimA-like FMN-containing flavoprotein (pyridoxamine 5'-phosphate oxidase superfamily)